MSPNTAEQKKACFQFISLPSIRFTQDIGVEGRASLLRRRTRYQTFTTADIANNLTSINLGGPKREPGRSYDSPFVRRVAISLHHYGLPFERQVMSVFKDFEAMLAINPMGKVPSLILDDGEVLFDSRAIIDFLDSEAPSERRLAPAAQPERRRVLQIEVVGVTLAEKIYERGIEHNRRAPGTSYPVWRARLERQIASICAWLEHRLNGDWFFGGGFCRADLAMAVSMQYLERVLPMLESVVRYPRLHAHRLRCESLEAFGKVRDAREEALRSGWSPENKIG